MTFLELTICLQILLKFVIYHIIHWMLIFIFQVMDNLLNKLEAGVMPHYMIPRTLGAMANANVNGVVPYLKDIFNNILPLLGGLKLESLKESFAFGN